MHKSTNLRFLCLILALGHITLGHKDLHKTCKELKCGKDGECRVIRGEAHCFCPLIGMFVHRPCNKKSICKTRPCKNGGKCKRRRKTVYGFQCECHSGFTGRKCGIALPETRVASCVDNCCSNGATCHPKVHGNRWRYECECAAGWWGSCCSRKAYTCPELDCFPGYCETGPIRAFCKCPSGSIGNFHCHEEVQGNGDLTACVDDKQCNGHGECFEDKAKPEIKHCHCHLGYTGENCNKKRKKTV